MTEGAEDFFAGTRYRMMACILVGLLSIAVLAPIFSSPKMYAHTIESLDGKKKDVQELTTAATATAVAITLLPGDAATPVAEKLADLSQYLLIVLCAIYLEKYLVTVMGLITFRYIIPLAMILLLINLVTKNLSLKTVAYKMVLFSLALSFVIPISIAITDLIEDTYKVSIETTLESSEELSQNLNGKGTADGDAQKENAPAETEEDKSLWDKIRDIPESVTENTTNVVNSLTQVSEEKLKELEKVLNNFMESIAVMLITSCVIPILVLIFFILVVKSVINTAAPTMVVLPESAVIYSDEKGRKNRSGVNDENHPKEKRKRRKTNEVQS